MTHVFFKQVFLTVNVIKCVSFRTAPTHFLGAVDDTCVKPKLSTGAHHCSRHREDEDKGQPLPLALRLVRLYDPLQKKTMLGSTSHFPAATPINSA